MKRTTRLFGSETRRRYEQAIRGIDATSKIFEVQIPSHLVELGFVPKVRLRLGLLKNGRVYPAVHTRQQREHLIPNRLRVFRSVEDAIEMKAPPPEVAPEREQSVPDLAIA